MALDFHRLDNHEFLFKLDDKNRAILTIYLLNTNIGQVFILTHIMTQDSPLKIKIHS